MPGLTQIKARWLRGCESARHPRFQEVAMLPTDTTTAPSSHADFLVACERVSHIWKERAQCEAASWAAFKEALTGTRDFAEALQAYADFSARRMQMMADDARRLFEEYQDITGRFPAGKSKSFANSLFV
jgi:hypothetical protein